MEKYVNTLHILAIGSCGFTGSSINRQPFPHRASSPTVFYGLCACKASGCTNRYLGNARKAVQGVIDWSMTVKFKQNKTWRKVIVCPEIVLDYTGRIFSRLTIVLPAQLESSSLTDKFFGLIKNFKIARSNGSAAKVKIKDTYRTVFSGTIAYTQVISSILGGRASVTGSKTRRSTAPLFLDDCSSVKI